MSSSAPAGTSVSTPTTDAMESLIAVTAQMSAAVVSVSARLFLLRLHNSLALTRCLRRILSQLQGPRVCATTRASSSASQTGAVSRPTGSVTVIPTVRTAATSTTPARLAPARPRSSAATMGTACCAAGFATGTTTAGT